MSPGDQTKLARVRWRMPFLLRRAIGLSLWLLLFFPAAVRAQQAPAPSEQELKSQRERTLAVSIVEQTASEAPLWDDKKSSVDFLLARSAGALP